MRRERGERPSLPRALRRAAIVVAQASFTPVASACPICQGETGAEVRAGIFNENFAFHLFGSLLPFLILLGIVAVIHGLPTRGTPAPATDSNRPRDSNELIKDS